MCVSLSSRGRSGWVQVHEFVQWGGYKYTCVSGCVKCFGNARVGNRKCC